VRNKRQEQVSKLRLRGLGVQEISEVLPKMGLVNLRTGRPFTIGTIAHDLRQIDERWRERTLINADVWKGRSLERNLEVIRVAWQAWQATKEAVFLKVIQNGDAAIRKLLDLDAPLKVDMGMRTLIEIVTEVEALERGVIEGKAVEVKDE